MNPTVWAIWLVQRAHTLKAGEWTVESRESQQRLSFASLYDFMQQQHSRRNRHELSLRDPITNKVQRYSLPFKAMRIPPAPDNLFKYRRGANRLSDWIVQGSSDGQSAGLAAGIIAMEPPQVVARPPGAARREARANAAWGRVGAAAQRRSALRSVVGESEDAESTRRVVDSVMAAAEDSDEEMERELERDMERGDGAGPSMPLEDVERALMADSDDEGGSGGAEELPEYERERLANIKRNQEVLRQLGLFQDPPLHHRLASLASLVLLGGRADSPADSKASRDQRAAKMDPRRPPSTSRALPVAWGAACAGREYEPVRPRHQKAVEELQTTLQKHYGPRLRVAEGENVKFISPLYDT